MPLSYLQVLYLFNISLNKMRENKTENYLTYLKKKCAKVKLKIKVIFFGFEQK